jgi:hypothetical protein
VIPPIYIEFIPSRARRAEPRRCRLAANRPPSWATHLQQFASFSKVDKASEKT